MTHSGMERAFDKWAAIIVKSNWRVFTIAVVIYLIISKSSTSLNNLGLGVNLVQFAEFEEPLSIWTPEVSQFYQSKLLLFVRETSL